MFNARVTVQPDAKKGEVVEIRAIARHPMERGNYPDSTGRIVPRMIIHSFRATYGGEEIFRADFGPGLSANPYVAFATVATETGDIVLEWVDDSGFKLTRAVRLTVIG
jgi:sulfur-oxidizing protein SoxZ